MSLFGNKPRTRRPPPRRQSTSPQAGFQATYHRSQAKVETEGKPRRAFQAPLTAAALLLALLGFLWLSYIQDVTVTGLDDEVVAADLAEDVAENYSFFWQVHEDGMQPFETLYARHVADITIRRDILDRQLYIVVREPEPVLQWQSGDRTYLIDNDGFAIAQDQAGEFPLVEDQASLPVEKGEQVAPAAFIDFVRVITESDLAIEQIRVIDTTSEIYVRLEEGYDVRMATTEDATIQLTNVARIQEIAQDRNDQITEYIDVRIPHKGYYR